MKKHLIILNWLKCTKKDSTTAQELFSNFFAKVKTKAEIKYTMQGIICFGVESEIKHLAKEIEESKELNEVVEVEFKIS